MAAVESFESLHSASLADSGTDTTLLTKLHGITGTMTTEVNATSTEFHHGLTGIVASIGRSAVAATEFHFLLLFHHLLTSAGSAVSRPLLVHNLLGLHHPLLESAELLQAGLLKSLDRLVHALVTTLHGSLDLVLLAHLQEPGRRLSGLNLLASLATMRTFLFSEKKR
jgi:hypothetical protein